MVSIRQARRAKEKLIEKYYNPEYVKGVGISRVGRCDANAPENQKEDYCIVVRLRESLPYNSQLPSRYYGVKVYAKVVGKIRPL